jgi:hypothetical protein
MAVIRLESGDRTWPVDFRQGRYSSILNVIRVFTPGTSTG